MLLACQTSVAMPFYHWLSLTAPRFRIVTALCAVQDFYVCSRFTMLHSWPIRKSLHKSPQTFYLLLLLLLLLVTQGVGRFHNLCCISLASVLSSGVNYCAASFVETDLDLKTQIRYDGLT